MFTSPSFGRFNESGCDTSPPEVLQDRKRLDEESNFHRVQGGLEAVGLVWRDQLCVEMANDFAVDLSNEEQARRRVVVHRWICELAQPVVVGNPEEIRRDSDVISAPVTVNARDGASVAGNG